MDLTLSLFPWAQYRKSKGAAKLHIGLDADGYLPAFVNMTAGKEHEINIARELKWPKGSYIVFDRGYTDYSWYQELTEDGVFFVTRLKTNAVTTPGPLRRGRKSPGVLRDQQIKLKGVDGTYRKVRYLDEETDITYEFLTNELDLPAATVAQLYKERWQIELFFKWIKQNLRVKSFLGHLLQCGDDPAVDCLCAYLVLAFLKFQSKLRHSMQQILRLLQLNLFERRDFMGLFKPPELKNTIDNNPLALI